MHGISMRRHGRISNPAPDSACRGRTAGRRPGDALIPMTATWNPGRRMPAAWALSWLSTVLLLLWWWATTRGPQASRALPSPAEVVGAWRALDAEGILWPSIAASLARAGVGLLLGTATAIPLGIVAGSSALGLSLVDRPIHMLRAIPFPALSPLFIIWFGIGETMKVLLIAVGAFGLVYVNLRDGVRAIDPGLLELAVVHRVPRRTIVLRILLPGAIPHLMTGLRFAVTVSWIGLVTCETVNSTTGIGYILSRSEQFSRMDDMVLCVVLYAVLGVLSEAAVGALERMVTPWAQVSGRR